MKKLQNNKGLTLVEMLCALLILVFVVVGMGITMDAGMNIYQDATFESESASLAGILNTSVGDILRYAEDITVNQGYLNGPNGTLVAKADVGFVFTSMDYGIQDAYFYTPVQEGNVSMGVLQMKNLRNTDIVELVNTGAYPDLAISNFKLTYVEPGSDEAGNTGRGGYFTVKYDIFHETDTAKKRHVEYVVRLMND